MDVTISDDFRDRGVDVTLGVLQFSVPAIGESRAASQLEATAEELAPLFEGAKPAELTEIAETRKAYRALGKDPGRYRPSSEALMRRIASGKPLPLINDVVDTGNVVSLTTRLSVGTYDASNIEGTITFRRAGDGEMAEAIGRGEMNFEHLPVFSDDIGSFGSPTSDTARTMVTPQARRIVMVLIAFEQRGDMDALLVSAEALVAELSGGEHVLTGTVKNW